MPDDNPNNSSAPENQPSAPHETQRLPENHGDDSHIIRMPEITMNRSKLKN